MLNLAVIHVMCHMLSHTMFLSLPCMPVTFACESASNTVHVGWSFKAFLF